MCYSDNDCRAERFDNVYGSGEKLGLSAWRFRCTAALSDAEGTSATPITDTAGTPSLAVKSTRCEWTPDGVAPIQRPGDAIGQPPLQATWVPFASLSSCTSDAECYNIFSTTGKCQGATMCNVGPTRLGFFRPPHKDFKASDTTRTSRCPREAGLDYLYLR